jgi:hypothetical protein
MTHEEQIAKMALAIKQAIKVMADRFGSTEQDVARAIEGLRASMQVGCGVSPSMAASTRPGSPSTQDQDVTVGT